MIKNIVFDMGRVLILFDSAYYMDEEGITDSADREIIEREVYKSYYWVMMDRGTLTPLQTAEKMCENIPERLHEKVHSLVYGYKKSLRSFPGMGDVVRELKKNGYGIYLLSNATFYQPEFWDMIDGSDCFDGTFISCDYKLLKPEKEIYEAFLDKFSLKVEECLFIDDVPANIEAAINCGFNGIVFHMDIAELRTKLHKMGVKISE